MANLRSGITSRKMAAIQLFRYGLIGIASNLAGYMVYLSITHLGIKSKVAMSVLYGVGAIVGFLGNRSLTFTHKGSLLGTGIRYIIVHCFGYLINLAILIVMVDKFGYPHQMVQAIAIFVVAAFLFLAFKFFVFTKLDLSNMEGK